MCFFQVNDNVLALLQEAADIGLSYYPERLGQMFVINVSSGDVGHLLLAARALGLGAAVDSGRLRVLPGELPKWAPELLKVRRVGGGEVEVGLHSSYPRCGRVFCCTIILLVMDEYLTLVGIASSYLAVTVGWGPKRICTLVFSYG